MEILSVPYNAHMVLHRDGHLCSAVVLEDRYIYPFVAIDNGLMYLGGFESYALRE